MNTSLEVKEDGQIWLWPDRPVEPNITDYGDDEYLYPIAHYTYDMEDYEKALASAERYLCADQSAAGQVIIDNHLSKGVPPSFRYIGDLAVGVAPGIYPIPDLKWERKKNWVSGDADNKWFEDTAVISLPESKNEK